MRFFAVDPGDKAGTIKSTVDKLSFDQLYIAYFDDDERSFRLAMQQFNGEVLFADGSVYDRLMKVVPPIGPSARQLSLRLTPPF